MHHPVLQKHVGEEFHGADVLKPISFSVSAPGKVILFGEHSVVYGYPAIAVAVDLRCHFDCSIDKRGIDVYQGRSAVKFTLKDLDNFQFSLVAPPPDVYRYAKCNQLRHEAMVISHALLENQQHTSSRSSLLHQSVTVLTYLFLRSLQLYPCDLSKTCSCLNHPDLEVNVLVHSDIPIGTGLGSSAAFAVSAATLFEILISGLPMKLTFIPDQEHCDKIQKLAHEAEVIMHDNPSGVDTTVSVFGGGLYFKRNSKSTCSIQTSCKWLMSHLDLLIVDSQISRSTKKMVKMVADQYKDKPDETKRIFESIGGLVDEAHQQMSEVNSSNAEDILANLIDRNQSLLHALNVSNVTLDHIIKVLLDIGLSSKITGAGGGGCVIGVCRQRDDTALQRAADRMHEMGFPSKIVRSFARGVYSSTIPL